MTKIELDPFECEEFLSWVKHKYEQDEDLIYSVEKVLKQLEASEP